MKIRMKIALFDWNGTLFNDAHHWYEATCATYFHHEMVPPNKAEFMRDLCDIQNGDFLAPYHKRGLTLTGAELGAIYGPHYNQAASGADLFSDVEAVFKRLFEERIPTYVLTANEVAQVSPHFNRHRLERWVKETHFSLRNKADAIRTILEAEQVLPEEAVFVGDMPADMIHAREAGVTSVAILRGHILDPEELFSGNAKPDRFIHSLDEL